MVFCCYYYDDVLWSKCDGCRDFCINCLWYLDFVGYFIGCLWIGDYFFFILEVMGVD